MAKRFKVGDHVSWNSEAGRVSGKIIKVHTRDVRYKVSRLETSSA
jgi:Hypervirulence associated proteins TUDOR domain